MTARAIGALASTVVIGATAQLYRTPDPTALADAWPLMASLTALGAMATLWLGSMCIHGEAVARQRAEQSLAYARRNSERAQKEASSRSRQLDERRNAIAAREVELQQAIAQLDADRTQLDQERGELQRRTRDFEAYQRHRTKKIGAFSPEAEQLLAKMEHRL